MAQVHDSLNQLLQDMWVDYCDLNPEAKRIYDLLKAEGETLENDHIALRTFKHPKLGIQSLANIFLKMGYQEKQDYHFPEKKLYAKHYEHNDVHQPKIFISELKLEETSDKLQKVISSIINEIPSTALADPKFTLSGRHWKIHYNTYESLAQESEYASWVYAIGFRPNHFTINVNALKKYSDLKNLNAFIQNAGYRMNNSGGLIKGSPNLYLEQSSTMAPEIPVQFTEGTYKIPGCYYEFAKRYRLPNGELYQGFVAASADKIFESTDRLK